MAILAYIDEYYCIIHTKHVITPKTFSVKYKNKILLFKDKPMCSSYSFDCQYNSMNSFDTDINFNNEFINFFRKIQYLIVLSEHMSNKEWIIAYLRSILFESSHPKGELIYFHYICKLKLIDNEFIIDTISQPFFPLSCCITGTNFFCGIEIINKNVIMTYSVDDAVPYINLLPLSVFNFTKNHIEYLNCEDICCIYDQHFLPISKVIALKNINFIETEILLNLISQKNLDKTKTLIYEYIDTLREENTEHIDLINNFFEGI